MPRPVYVLLAHSTAVDPASGEFSVLQLVEKLTLTGPRSIQHDDATKIILIENRPLRAVAVWMIEEEKGDNYGDIYEHEFIFSMDSGARVTPPRVVPFMFGVQENGKLERRPLHRHELRIEGHFLPPTAGIMLVESKIRKAGSDSWVSQNYPVIVEIGAVTELTRSIPKADAT